MRVITGIARGRRLQECKGTETRPTTEKVKEAIFSSIQFEIEGRSVLDLFAGTGQLGIEALSRGAASAVFIDRRPEAVRLIRENLRCTHLEENAQVFCAEALSYLSSSQHPFDLIFLDPPYAEALLESALEKIVLFDILAPYGIMVAETPADKQLSILEEPSLTFREYRYGRTKTVVFRRNGTNE